MFERLKEPFPIEDIEWRIQRSGLKEGVPWGLCLAYIDARAVSERLDEVFGVLGWQTEHTQIEGGFICKLSVYDKEYKEWVSKTDGAPNTEFEPLKGGISGSTKRVAASGYGIGRYLYNLKVAWAEFDENGKYKIAIKDDNGTKHYFKWNPPELPDWALPKESEEKSTGKKAETEANTPVQNDNSGEYDREQPIWFGKHKGILWKDIDPEYLAWISKNMTSKAKQFADAELALVQTQIDESDTIPPPNDDDLPF